MAHLYSIYCKVKERIHGEKKSCNLDQKVHGEKRIHGEKSHAISIHGAQGRIRIGHTCILFIVNSNRGSMEKQVMQS